MTEQVERKKSYRWVSAGQASYDGADWNSSDDSSGEDEMTESSLKRGDTISRLPALPKLDYNENSEEELAKIGNRENSDEGPTKDQETIDQKVKPQSLAAEDREESSSVLGTPTLGKTLSHNSAMSPSHVRRTPVNEDLENLMAQISKEMTPKVEQSEQFDEEGHSDQSDGISPSGLERRLPKSDSQSEDEDELKVSKSGYFSKFIKNNDGDDYITDDVSSSHSQAEELTRTHSPAVEVTGGQREAEKDNLIPEPDHQSIQPSAGSDRASFNAEDSHSLQQSSDGGAFLSSDVEEEEDDDALSYTNSIKYQARQSIASEKQSSDQEGEVDSREDVDIDSSDGEIRVSESGYFNKMVSDSDSSALEQDSHDEEDEKTIPETIESVGECQAAKNGEEVGSIPRKQSWDEVVESEDSQDNRIETSSHEQNEQNQGGSTEAIAVNEHSNENKKEVKEEVEHAGNDKEDREGDQVADQIGDVTENNEKLSSTRQSINLGKWKPDTSAFRNNFVQETSNNPPPGYVYDETGKLVDLTPSSMKSRIVSTYSEAESAWNAFPSEGNEDLETVRDTKTLYDNNTIYNVPGIISNNQNLPPLPNIARSDASSDDPRSLGTGNSTTLTLDGEGRREPLQTHFKEVFTVPEPNAKDIAKVTGSNAVPYMDLNKIVSGKNSHAHKIEQLRSYSRQLHDYDTGIQTWLGYTLKSSSKTDRDFIFDEYKVSNHVRDAYAHADELSKKHTVSNTVANVNQNVSHLTKKVFAHSKKSRGLFSSIGKKRV